MNPEGHIPLARRIFANFLWQEERKYSRFEAWLDLIQTARWQNETGVQIVNSQAITLERGEIVGSVRFLAQRWGWNKNAVGLFLRLLTSQAMIEIRQAGQSISVLKLCNYDTYNNGGTVSGTVSGTVAGQSRDSRGTNLNKDNKGIKKEEREERASKARPHSLDELVAFCVELGLPARDGEAQWHSWEGNGHTVNGKAMKDWKATIRAWKAKGYMASQRNKPTNGYHRQAEERRELTLDEMLSMGRTPQ